MFLSFLAVAWGIAEAPAIIGRNLLHPASRSDVLLLSSNTQLKRIISPRQAMIDEFDLDQDGEINEQEFFAIMTDDA